MSTLFITIAVPIEIFKISIHKFAFANAILLIIIIIWMLDKIIASSQINKMMPVMLLTFFSVFMITMMYFDYIRFSVFKSHMNEQSIQILQKLHETDKIKIKSYHYSRVAMPIWNESIYKRNLQDLRDSPKKLMVEQKYIKELDNFEKIRNDIPLVCKNEVLRWLFYCTDK